MWVVGRGVAPCPACPPLCPQTCLIPPSWEKLGCSPAVIPPFLHPFFPCWGRVGGGALPCTCEGQKAEERIGISRARTDMDPAPPHGSWGWNGI